MVHFIVFPRRGEEYAQKLAELKNSGWDFELVNSSFMDISSTEIRKSKNKEVNTKVGEYIEDHGLYKS